MKKKLLIILLNVYNIELFAQCSDTYTGFGSVQNDEGQVMITDSLQNIYLSGMFTNSIQLGNFFLLPDSAQKQERFLCKISPSGIILWAKSLCRNSPGFYAPTMKFDHAGQLVVAGTCDVVNGQFDTITNAFLNGDLYISKFNPATGSLTSFISTGRHLWVGTTDFDIDNNDNIYMTGVFVGVINFTGLSMSCTGTGNTFIVKFNLQNQAQWARRVTTNPLVSGNNASCIDYDIYNHIYVAGMYGINADFGNGIALNSSSYYNRYIAKYDLNGTVEWARSSDTNKVAVFQSVNDTNSITVLESSPDKFVNYDRNGDTIWTKTITNYYNNGSSRFNKVISKDLKYFITGNFHDSLFIDGSLYSNTGYNFFAGYFNLNGTFHMLRVIHTNYSIPKDIAIDNQNNIFLTGYYYPYDTINQTTIMPWWGGQEILFAKLCNVSLSSQTENSKNDYFSVYPNPVKTMLNVSFNGTEDISIINLMGETVIEKKAENIHDRNFKADVSFLSPGIYFIKSGNDVRKFVKE